MENVPIFWKIFRKRSVSAKWSRRAAWGERGSAVEKGGVGREGPRRRYANWLR